MEKALSQKSSTKRRPSKGFLWRGSLMEKRPSESLLGRRSLGKEEALEEKGLGKDFYEELRFESSVRRRLSKIFHGRRPS